MGTSFNNQDDEATILSRKEIAGSANKVSSPAEDNIKTLFVFNGYRKHHGFFSKSLFTFKSFDL
jgi:hypothetical protein